MFEVLSATGPAENKPTTPTGFPTRNFNMQQHLNPDDLHSDRKVFDYDADEFVSINPPDSYNTANQKNKEAEHQYIRQIEDLKSHVVKLEREL